jgi:predicted kinase
MDNGNKEQELVVLRGLPASGKSTFAREWVAEDPDWRFRVNRDDIRMAGYNMLWGLSRHMEENVSLSEVAQAEAALAAGLSVIIDATNLRARVVKEWYAVANKMGVSVRVHDIDTGLEECIVNDMKREKKVGPKVITDFNDRYFQKGKLPPVPENIEVEPLGRAWVPNPDLPDAVWVDIDGTLAERVHDLAPQPVRGPFDEDRVYEDAVREHIADLVRILHAAGKKIIIMSGRTDSCQEETERWLLDNNIPYDEIFMRRTVEDKGRKDNLVKHDLFWANVAPKYNVIFALDDRQQVVDFTRDVLKIPVLQVQPGLF